MDAVNTSVSTCWQTKFQELCDMDGYRVPLSWPAFKQDRSSIVLVKLPIVSVVV